MKLFINVFAESDSGGGGRGRIASDGGEVKRRTIPRKPVLKRARKAIRKALKVLIPRNLQRRQRSRIPRG